MSCWLGNVNRLFYICFQPVNIDQEESSDPPIFEWISLDNISSLEQCRNSQQGSAWIVDELGQFNIMPPA